MQARGAALLRYGYVLTENPDDAADLVQEALLKLGGTWRKVRNKDNPESYIRTIMTRQHVSWWRGRRREQLTDEVPEGAYTDSHSSGELWRELATLPRRQRVVLVLLATFDRPGIWWGNFMSAEPSTTMYWSERGDEYRVLNLAAVPPAQ
ncbi:sigma factor [Nonomuraea sp. NPDC047529]|uniref:sigma factor n=1 Tax=Nonomuraea sp. NPDC047529 TaxID=3155623 RepID=UPI0033DBBD1D